MPAVIVTGAAGFIGSHLCQALLARGDDVIGIDNFDPLYPRAIKQRNLAALAGAETGGGGESFTLHELDICDAAALAQLVGELRRKHDQVAVVHLAARAGVRPSLAAPTSYARTNLEGTVAVLEAVRKVDAAMPVVIASSSSVYGDKAKAPFAEEDAALTPISPYAATKRACELMAYTYHHLYAMPIGCLRFFTVYGPRQRPDLAISLFIDQIYQNRPITMYGAGDSSRDYTFIDDIIGGILAAMERISAHGYRIWNLGNSQPISLRDLINAIGAALQREPAVRRQPPQPGDVPRTWADLTRSRAELDYKPATPLEAGIAAQVRAYLDEARRK